MVSILTEGFSNLVILPVADNQLATYSFSGLSTKLSKSVEVFHNFGFQSGLGSSNLYIFLYLFTSKFFLLSFSSQCIYNTCTFCIYISWENLKRCLFSFQNGMLTKLLNVGSSQKVQSSSG